MDALLTAIVVWLSTNFGLPANFESPRIRFASSAELNFPLKGSVGSEAKNKLRQPKAVPILSHSTAWNRRPSTWRMGGPEKLLLNYPFLSTRWCIIYKMSGNSNLNARRHEKSLHIRRRIAGYICLVMILSGISSWTDFQFW